MHATQMIARTHEACMACGTPHLLNDLRGPEEERTVCPECARRYPASLLKALFSPGHYILCLAGHPNPIRFSQSIIHGHFASLLAPGGYLEGWFHLVNDSRGGLRQVETVDVRIASIVWCAEETQTDE